MSSRNSSFCTLSPSPCSRRPFIIATIFFTLTALFFIAAARDVEVQWTNANLYQNFANEKALSVGDVVVFYYKPFHTVERSADFASFNNCSKIGLTNLGAVEDGTQGVRVTVTQEPQYIICMVDEHCARDQMKIIIEPSPLAPASAPGPGPAAAAGETAPAPAPSPTVGPAPTPASAPAPT